MSLTPVLFLFLCHLGIGIVFTMLLVSSAAGVRFFRFTSATAVIVMALGIAFRPAAIRLAGDAQGVASAGLLATLLALSLVVAPWNPWRRALLWLSAASGLVTLVAQAAAATTSLPLALTIASFVASAALLGSSFTAMLLGHWYLVLPTMDVSLLQRVVKFHLGSTAVRALAVLAVGCAAAVAWSSLQGPSFSSYLLSVDGVFVWQRVLFGLIGPAVLAWMTWETAKLRATQSATGILYVDLFMVIGEAVASTCSPRPWRLKCRSRSVRCGGPAGRRRHAPSRRPLWAAVVSLDRLGDDRESTRVPSARPRLLRAGPEPPLGLAAVVVVGLVSAAFLWSGRDRPRTASSAPSP
jgi:hypothetical protein